MLKPLDKFRLILSLSLLFCGQALLFASSKIDTIYFQNGDRITAEVKFLSNNQLKLSTDDAGTFYVEWKKVDSVKILNSMRIVLENGEIMYGKILPSGEVRSCYIWHREGDPRLVDLSLIVELSPIEEKFLERLNGSLSSGFSYTKASDVMQFNVNGSVQYLAEKNHIELSYDGIFTQDSAAYTQWQTGEYTFRRILPRKWFLVSSLTAESSSEQQLDLRVSVSLGGGNSLIISNTTHLYVAAGIIGNRETSEGADQYNIEAVIGAKYAVFIFDSPDLSFDIGGNLIPSLNNLGRIRTHLDSNLKWEMFSDFYLKWTFFYNFDNRSLATGSKSSDWAVTLLGIEYKL